MDILEEAKIGVESGSALYAEFSLDFHKENDTIYCFFEGKEDRSYYSFRIKSFCHQKGYFDYVCNGKGNLLKLHELINQQKIYRESNIGYFVDNDFDSIALPSNIYVTPYYSIENFYVVDEAFENILINEFNINRSCQCFALAKNIFTSLKDEFHSKVVILNAWLACQTDFREKNNISTRLNIDRSLNTVLGNEKFNKIVHPKLNSVKYPIELLSHSKIEGVFNKSPKIDEALFESMLQKYKSLNGDEKYRGKFELKFLVSFLNRFKDEIGKSKSAIFSKKYKSALRFEYSTSVSQLTNNAVTPQCLIDYIKGINKAPYLHEAL